MRTFYDSLGQKVETRTPGPGSHDTIVFTYYNDQAHSVFTSVPFQIASGSTWVDPNNATDYTGKTVGGTAIYYDALGRELAYKDPSYGSAPDGISCSFYLGSANTYTGCTNYLLASPNGDSNTYEAIQSVDANSHSVAAFNDALGRTIYTQWYKGNSAGYTGLPANTSANEQQTVQYNALNEPTSVSVSDLKPQSGESTTPITTTATYNSMGKLKSLNDPDRGNHTYTYDADGNLLTDVSGSRTLGYSYDLLGRLGCIQDHAPTINATGACSSGANPFVINTYDADPTGVTWGSTNYAKGRLTQSYAVNYFPAPDNTQGKVTENMQYDVRGRLITERLQITATGGTLTFPTFPTYQMALTYNDADQVVTTTTSSSNPSGLGYTTTNVYDSTGNLSGLSNNSTQTADLATLSYDTHAQISQITFLASDGTSSLALDQFSYDANLRPYTTTATWQSGSGTTGTIFSQARNYDAVGNVVNLSTTQATVPGTNNSGGSENEVFCYDEQNRLVWAGSNGTPPSAGSGTCGSGTPSNTISGANYSDSYAYTHQGQLWQGSYNGKGAYQYLYCNSSQPHQLTGLYPTGTTCSTTGGQTQTYGASYNSWGDLKTRTATGSGGTTATLNDDAQDHLVRWQDNNSSSNEEWYMYDSSGQRILRRSQTGSGNSNTKYTITVFGLEDHIYDGGGSSLNSKYYYSLAGRLIGVLNNTGTNFLFTDALGSVVSTISNTANSASVGGNQVYGPYGNNPYSKGTMGTTKGYTGQYNDSLTQLDYYGARYYDPFVGVFLSADEVQGNFAGMNPYNYVGDNPETNTDPSGQAYRPIVGGGGGPVIEEGGGGTTVPQGIQDSLTDVNLDPGPDTTVTSSNESYTYDNQTGSLTITSNGGQSGISYLPADTGYGDAMRTYQGLVYLASRPLTLPQTVNSVTFAPFAHSGSGPQTQPGSGGGRVPPGGAPPVAPASEPCSFTSTTQVTTDHGKEPIGKVQVGEKVLAYNPSTHKMEAEPVLHVWKHSDSDLIDLTLTTVTTSQYGQKITRKSEVVHTTSEHPFLTKEHGFVPAGKLKPGMHVLRADGSFGILTGWKSVHATKVMYNLEVAQDHTFVVGDGQWVVHNECNRPKLRENMMLAQTLLPKGYAAHHIIPCELEDDPLFQKSGLSINSGENGVGLPMTDEQARMDNLPKHSGSHPDYTARARLMLISATNDLAEEYGSFNRVEGSVANNTVQQIISTLRDRIMSAGGECTINDV